MKFATPLIEHVIEFREGAVYSLVIENQICFRRLLEDIAAQIDGEKGSAVISVDNAPISLAKGAELLQCFAPFSINRRTLLNKIVATLEKSGLDESHYLETNTLLVEWEHYIRELAIAFPCGIICEKMTLGNVLKAAGISIEEESGELLERVLAYLELVREFDSDKLFIFVNLRSYLNDEQMNSFAETITGEKYRILLIEGYERPPFLGEKRWLVDRDWCEI